MFYGRRAAASTGSTEGGSPAYDAEPHHSGQRRDSKLTETPARGLRATVFDGMHPVPLPGILLLVVVRVEPATVAWLEALVAGDAVFAHRFAVRVVPGWAGFPEAVPVALAAARAGEPAMWGAHLLFDEDGALVGFGGWKGAPRNRVAELGYAVAPERRGHGIATAAVRELLERGRAAGLRAVVAHTLPEASASTAVLCRCGFTCFGEVDDDGDQGVVWRWELLLAGPEV